MGALAPVTSWTSEDYHLLKNAMETGASLESLAKGAVQFSRRFTVQELEDRWHSLLYDPVASVEASVLIVEYELSASRKRKNETVRNCYYAMLERVRNNVIQYADQPPSADCMTGEAMQNHLQSLVSNHDVLHQYFPNFETVGAAVVTSVGVTSHTSCTGDCNFIEVDLPVDQNSIQINIAHNFEENHTLMGSRFVAEEVGQPKDMSVYKLFDAGDLDAKSLTSFDQPSINDANGASFHYFGYSSRLPEIPIRNTVESISAPTLPVHLGGKERNTENSFELPNDAVANKAKCLEYYVHSDAMNQISCDIMNNSPPSTDDYVARLDYLLNFTNEEELFMEADGKDTIDRYDLSSLLLASPGEDNRANISVSEALVPPDEHFNIRGGKCPRDLGDEGQYHLSGWHTFCTSKIQMLPSIPAANPEFPELRNGVICCILNTEDLEIPCNDDALIPTEVLSLTVRSVMPRKILEANLPTSSAANDFSSSQKINDRGPNQMKREQNNCGKPNSSSEMIQSQILSELGIHLPFNNHGVKFELHKSDVQHIAACEAPSQHNSKNVCSNNLLPVTVKEEVPNTKQLKNLSYNPAYFEIEKQACDFDIPLSCPQKNHSVSKQEVDASGTIQRIVSEALHVGVNFTEMTVPVQVSKSPLSNQEEFPSEIDIDVPNFSDVETMILDMELSPDGQEPHSSCHVSGYHEDTVRTIIRLEQAADAHMRREIASQGALAILYGHHLKHYIRKPEVLLGRATQDFNVDIDLGEEGPANKISRRQAIIKVDNSGSFRLENLGKCSIFVNAKEVASKQSLRLPSCCLISIMDMAFVFQANGTRVTHYLDRKKIRKLSQEKKRRKNQIQEHKV